MYRKDNAPPIEAENFDLPFGGQLAPDNRWVVMANLIDWAEWEGEYAANFCSELGAPAKTFRVALGALIIKEKLGLSDREAVEQIRENPYLQYFIGFKSYSNELPFDPSLLVHFRQRITPKLLGKINHQIVRRSREIAASSEESSAEQKSSPSNSQSEVTHRGKLIVDSTVAPADISYPTDLNLLNQARVVSEELIDRLYETLKGIIAPKPRTYRRKARKDYLAVAKKRKPSRKERKTALKKQLQYLKRNLSHLDNLMARGASLESLSRRQYRRLLVITEVYRQQQGMYSNNQRRIEDRIVSLSQPQVRPIVRGKAGHPVEFGAKLSVSCCEGYVFLDRISWDNYNESTDLIGQIEAYYQRMGCYPESVHVDRIYRTRANRFWCQERGIRLSGPPLGRPPKEISPERKRQQREDEKIRNAIEGKFGQGKRRFSLNRILTKLKETSETAIALTFLVMNLVTLWRQVYCLFFWANFAKLRIRKPLNNQRLSERRMSLMLAYQSASRKSSSNWAKLVA